MVKYILSISNKAYTYYEIFNLTAKREKYYLVDSIDEIIKHINERIEKKECKVVVAKIINLADDEQLTIEICFNSVNLGLAIKRTNPNKSLIYNSILSNIYKTKDFLQNIPFTYEKFMNINLINKYFNNN